MTLTLGVTRFQQKTVEASTQNYAYTPLPPTELHAQSIPTFSAAPVPTGAYSAAIAAGDLNGDGTLDLVVANYDGGSVTVLLDTTPAGASTPTFAPALNIAMQDPGALALADFDGDGKLDILVAHDTFVSGSATLTTSVLLNQTLTGSLTASFSAPIDITTAQGNCPPFICIAHVADFNHDGKPDLLLTRSLASDVVSVLLNTTTQTGTPTFGSEFDFSVGNQYVQAANIADINADGKPDIIAVSGGATQSLLVFLNTTVSSASAPTFQNVSLGPIVGLVGGDGAIDSGDIDGDGLVDIAVSDQYQHLAVFFNRTTAGASTASVGSQINLATLSPLNFNPNPFYPVGIAFGDVDGDGRIDVVTSAGAGGITAFINTPSGSATSFTRIDYAGNGTPDSQSGIGVVVGDVNRDGRLDVCTTDESGVSVLLGN